MMGLVFALIPWLCLDSGSSVSTSKAVVPACSSAISISSPLSLCPGKSDRNLPPFETLFAVNADEIDSSEDSEGVPLALPTSFELHHSSLTARHHRLLINSVRPANRFALIRLLC